MSEQRRNLEADQRFIEAAAPLLDQGAWQRAKDVRLRVGDPIAGLLG